MTEYQEKLKLAQMLQGKYCQLGVNLTITSFECHFSLIAQIHDSKDFPVVGVESNFSLTIPELYELNTVLDAELTLKA
jgi:hypothetical protein